MNKLVIYIVLAALLFSCRNKGHEEQSTEMILDSASQVRYYADVVSLLNSSAKDFSLHDSLSLLILPVLEICPSCRTKAIKSIVRFQHTMPADHVVVLSGKTSRKMIRSYFLDEGEEIPSGQHILLDTLGVAGARNLYDAKPTIYYIADKRVYKIVSSYPATIKRDLKEYFKLEN